MHIRTFRAASLQDALAEIRQQMGPDASVLHTRQVRDGVLGWLGRTHVEVTAGLRDESERKRPVHAPVPVMGRSEPRPSSGQPTTADFVPRSTSTGRDEIAARLAAAGVPHEVAGQWLEQAQRTAQTALGLRTETLSASLLEEHLKRNLSHSLSLQGPVRAPSGQRRIVALVGPTGVGKTTTIAKLAAGFRIQQKRRVGLLTIDTYRIAAVQQLQAYAEIMDLPMQVVESAGQMKQGIDALGDVELILIDTAGRSPRLRARIQQLQQLLGEATPQETHLVVSATASVDSIRATLEGFAPVAPTATILTKLDETKQLAGVLASLQADAPPLSYLTTGQQVPDDIETASVESLLARFFEEDQQRRQAA